MGRKLSKGWVEYGAIDHTIIDKLQNEDDTRVRLQGAEELNRCMISLYFRVFCGCLSMLL